MLLQDSLKTDTRNNPYSHILLPLLVIMVAVVITTISNNYSLKLDSALMVISLLGGVYFFNIFLYFPILIVIQFIRGERAFGLLIIKCLSILLWSFIPLALLWIGASIINLTFYKLPWSVFSIIFLWGKAIVIPLSLFYFYKRFSKESLYDSLIDSMLACGFVVILSLIGA